MSRDRAPTGLNDDDRGVSEVVAFVLVFGIILSSVAILSMTGFQAMDDYQEHEQIRNAERAMESLADNFNDVVRYDGIDRRYGELSLRGGTITTGNEGTKLDVSVDGDSIGEYDTFSHLDDDSIDLGEFTYETGSDTIAYDGGSVIRAGETGSVVVTEPHLKYTDHGDHDVAIISLVKIDAENRSLQSSETSGFTMNVENRSSEVYTDADVTIEPVDPSYDAWEGVLESGGWDDGHDDVDRVLVTVVTVDVEY